MKEPKKLAFKIGPLVTAGLALFIAAAVARAQVAGGGSDPWSVASTRLQTAFTGTIARALSLVAIVSGGLMFAFGEGGSKRMLAGIVFGIGMAIGAVNFLSWLFT